MKVLAVVVPPTVTAAVLAAVIVPSATDSVTVSRGESMSANGVEAAGQRRLPFTSSVTVNDFGANTLGASLTGVIARVLATFEESVLVPEDSAIVVVRVLAALLLATGV